MVYSSCSTEKNTLITRGYHNLTSRYNILFNGKESFKKGKKRVAENYDYDYTRILPIFLYDDESIAQSVAPEMDRTISKSTKVITLHSIKAKPEYKNGPATPRQKAFYELNEYNKWMDENYLLMGKAYFYKHEFYLALETFRFILNEFPNNPVRFETLVWMARARIELEEYRDAMDILELLDSMEDFPENLYGELEATKANYYLKQEQYERAIPWLEKALENVRKKPREIRYTYILAQLYQRTGNFARASEMYEKVTRMNPPYEFAFNARINRAGVFVTGAGNSKEITRELRKMLKDDKNIDYQDQIYYALGNVKLRENKEDEAIEMFKKSVHSSINNVKQKTISYLTIADIYYERTAYEQAESYYDSAVIAMDNSYPNYEEVLAKSRSLTTLVQHINKVSLEDSVQLLAMLDESDLYARIDAIIEDVRRKEQEETEREREMMEDRQYDRMMMNDPRNPASGNTGGTWYFYNNAAKSFGQPEFRMKWGNRKLEDNWRRSNKSAVSFEDQEETVQVDSAATQVQTKLLSNKTREFYLQNVPLTDSMMARSHDRIKYALYHSGNIYKDELNDKEKAIESFTDLVERYPGSAYTLSAYYSLYDLHRSENQPAMAEKYKNLLVKRYPNSQPAKILSDPNYVAEYERMEQQKNDFYEDTYSKYREGLYAQVIENADHALDEYDDPDLIPRFYYLKTLAIGKIYDERSFRNELDTVRSRYPDHEVARQAQQIITLLDEARPELKEEADLQEAKTIYEPVDTASTHVVLLQVNKNANINQLKFDLINFNLDYYPDRNFEIVEENIKDDQVSLSIRTFADLRESKEYLLNLLEQEEIFTKQEGLNQRGMLISTANLGILLEEKLMDQYKAFFNENYDVN